MPVTWILLGLAAISQSNPHLSLPLASSYSSLSSVNNSGVPLKLFFLSTNLQESDEQHGWVIKSSRLHWPSSLKTPLTGQFKPESDENIYWEHHLNTSWMPHEHQDSVLQDFTNSKHAQRPGVIYILADQSSGVTEKWLKVEYFSAWNHLARIRDFLVEHYYIVWWRDVEIYTTPHSYSFPNCRPIACCLYDSKNYTLCLFPDGFVLSCLFFWCDLSNCVAGFILRNSVITRKPGEPWSPSSFDWRSQRSFGDCSVLDWSSEGLTTLKKWRKSNQ